MKRKAMLMGMAVMTGLPGWALAKGAGKADNEAHAPPPGAEALETLDRIEVDNELSVSTTGRADTARKASEVLAQIKAALKGVNYGVVSKQVAQEWSMELMERNPGAVAVADEGDPRLKNAKPVGVAFRMKF